MAWPTSAPSRCRSCSTKSCRPTRRFPSSAGWSIGDPASEIPRVAKEENVDLIVMGTHGRTGLLRMLMGSVAELVVRRAHCAVLTVRQPETRSAVSDRAAKKCVHRQPL